MSRSVQSSERCDYNLSSSTEKRISTNYKTLQLPSPPNTWQITTSEPWHITKKHPQKGSKSLHLYWHGITIVWSQEKDHYSLFIRHLVKSGGRTIIRSLFALCEVGKQSLFIVYLTWCEVGKNMEICSIATPNTRHGSDSSEHFLRDCLSLCEARRRTGWTINGSNSLARLSSRSSYI